MFAKLPILVAVCPFFKRGVMQTSHKYRTFLNVIDNSVATAEHRVEKRGESVSCSMGCDHCCHMLVETTWDEALVLARWVHSQPPTQRQSLVQKIRRAANERQSFFSKRSSTERYRRPTTSGKEISAKVCREYFYERPRPCPLLLQGVCSAYEVRPSACRLHIVTSPAQLCSRKNKDDSDVEIPKEIEEQRDKVEDAAERALPDPRWGEFSIMLSHALDATAHH